MDNKIFLHFNSLTPFTLHLNGEYAGIVDNETTFSIDILLNSNKLFFTFSPTENTNNFLPITKCINLINNKPTIDSELIKIVPFKNNHYDIIISPLNYTSTFNSKILNECSYNNCTIQIISNPNTNVYIHQNGNLKLHKTLKIYDSAIIENTDNIYKVICANSNEYEILLISKTTFEVLFNITCNSFEENENTIKTLSKVDDIPQHGIVNEYNYSTNESSNHLIYLENTPRTPTNTTLIPLAFLECIKIKNYKLAKSYLVDTIANATDDYLQNYFGEIKNIYFDRHCENSTNYIIENNTYTNYEFILHNSKIVEIIK